MDGERGRGSSAAVILSDFGADVIKVEPPSGELWRHAHNLLGATLFRSSVSNRIVRSTTVSSKIIIGPRGMVTSSFRLTKRWCDGGCLAPRRRPLMQMEILMKSLSTIAVAVLLIATPACFAQQVVGSTQLGVANLELHHVTTPCTTNPQIPGKNA